MAPNLYINVVIVDGVGCLLPSLLLLTVQLQVLPLAGCAWLLPGWSTHPCRGGEDRAGNYPGAGQVSSVVTYTAQPISIHVYIVYSLVYSILV